ncbi:MAG: peptidase M14 [Solirubrobacterales bacterium]|nr:peptidase M14 [Solirubrobacterales bacterium]
MTREVTAPSIGMVSASLEGSGGDWDLAILDAQSGDVVAGSAYPGASELAEGFTQSGQQLVVQACRLSGSGQSAELNVEFATIENQEPVQASVVRVETPTDDALERLLSLGLDNTEHGGADYADVVTYGFADFERLESAGLSYETVVPDLAQQTLENAQADRAFARGTANTGLPSGRDTYRRLFEYSQTMKRLAENNPKIVRLFKLKHKTYEGRPVMGLEIATKVRKNNGRPAFLQMGVHHAREWPSSEHAMEWAIQLVKGYKQGDKRTRKLMRQVRTLVVPIVNPDGFNTSREAGELAGAGDGRGGANELANLVIPYEYQRKNCRLTKANEDPGTKPREGEGDCMQTPATGLSHFGVDPNRNYGSFWGGPGATPPGGNPPGDLAADYRGPGPFSEPETRNIQTLVSRNQVVTLITNHTYSDLVLRPPGIQSQGKPVDEKVYKALGARLAAENGYINQPSYKLYDTTGTTEDWSYYATGGLGFTFEIGCAGNDPQQGCDGFFHPPFEETVAQYDGSAPESGAGGGNRAAYFKMMKAAANTNLHSVIKGKAPRGAELKLSKKFKTATSPVLKANGDTGKRRFFTDRLRTVMRVPQSGRFTWDVNPSTRPLVAQTTGRRAKGDASETQQFSGTAATTVPCADAETDQETCFNDHGFRVPGGRGVDNYLASIRTEWADPASDWDMFVFTDKDGDGSSVGEKEVVGSSAQGITTFEQVEFAAPLLEEKQKYVVRMVNFAAADPYKGTIDYKKSPKFEPARTERWKLTCTKASGRSVDRILVDRGEVANVDLAKTCRG